MPNRNTPPNPHTPAIRARSGLRGAAAHLRDALDTVERLIAQDAVEQGDQQFSRDDKLFLRIGVFADSTLDLVAQATAHLATARDAAGEARMERAA